MKRYILFYEHLVREWNALCKVKNILERNGDEAECFSIIYETNKALKYAKRKKVDVIAVPWFVDEEHEKVLHPFISVNSSVKIVNLHQEQIGSKASEAVFLPRTPYTANGCFHIAWGTNFYDLLIGGGVTPNKIFITGNMRTDFTDFGEGNKEHIINKYQLDYRKKIILFAENRGYYIQRIDDTYAASLAKRGITRENIKLRREYETESIKNFVKDLQSLDESFWSKYQIVYRPHPGTIPPDGIPDCVHIISELSIYDWINICDIFVTCGSTSAFEADMCGKVCLTCDAVDEPEEQKMQGLDFYHHIRSLKNILDSSLSFTEILSKQVKEKNYQKYIGSVDGKSCERVAKTLSDLAEKVEEGELNYNIANPSVKEIIRYKIYEKATWFMAKTGLLYLFKFPRSAYAESRDIPCSKEAKWIHMQHS